MTAQSSEVRKRALVKKCVRGVQVGGGGGGGGVRDLNAGRVGPGWGTGGAGSECRLWLWRPSLNWLGQLRPAETRDTAVVRRC